MKSRSIIGSLNYLFFGSLILLALGFFAYTQSGGQFSLIEEGQITSGDCVFVKNGDVCSQYTDCNYISERDVSCIRGSEIITQDVLPEPTSDSSYASGEINE